MVKSYWKLLTANDVLPQYFCAITFCFYVSIVPNKLKIQRLNYEFLHIIEICPLA